jgi:hypothetical protein
LAEFWVLDLQLGEDFARAIARPVVHAEQFETDRYGEYFSDDFMQRGTFIVDWH